MVSLFRTKQRKRDNIDETVSLEYSLGIIDENVRTKTKPFAHWLGQILAITDVIHRYPLDYN